MRVGACVWTDGRWMVSSLEYMGTSPFDLCIALLRQRVCVSVSMLWNRCDAMRCRDDTHIVHAAGVFLLLFLFWTNQSNHPPTPAPVPVHQCPPTHPFHSGCNSMIYAVRPPRTNMRIFNCVHCVHGLNSIRGRSIAYAYAFHEY